MLRLLILVHAQKRKMTHTNSDIEIRVTVLRSLDTSKLFRFLSQSVFLDTLFMFMRDESAVVQEEALSRIGELAVVNPGMSKSYNFGTC